MTQHLFAAETAPSLANLDANFTEVYGFSRSLFSDGSGNVGIGVPASASAKLLISASGSSALGIAIQGHTTSDVVADIIVNRTGAQSTSVGVGSSIQLQNTTDGKGFLLQGYEGGLLMYGNNGSGWSEFMRLDGAGNVIPKLNSAVPTLSEDRQMVFSLTSNTNLRISARGSDGVTRVTNLTLA